MEVRRWMNRARVLAVPSVRAPSGETEALSMVLLEAQAMALPVAAFDSGGIREAMGENGLLAPEADVGQLGADIEALLTRDPLWHRISAAGRRAVIERFNLVRQTAILEDLYDRVLARRQRQATEAPILSCTPDQLADPDKSRRLRTPTRFSPFHLRRKT